jgi:hypothetical protein
MDTGIKLLKTFFACSLLLASALFISACGPSGSGGGGDSGDSGDGGDPTQPAPDNNLSPRIFILGSGIDAEGRLHIYVHGLDSASNFIPLQAFQNLSVVTVDGAVRLDNGVDVGVGGVSVRSLGNGDPISLSILTDYSVSIPQASLETISEIYEVVLNSLPSGFEAQVLNFSNLTDVRQDWTTNRQTLLAAVQFDQDIFRANTALYDGIGNSLYREAPGLGLSDRCQPARMLLTYTDGVDNASFLYNKNDLLDEIDSSRTVAIMLGTVNSNKAELEEFAGTRGAFVYAFDVDDFTQDILNWAESLENIVEFVIDAGTYNQDPPGAVQIAVATIDASVEAPYVLDCIPAP